MAKRTVRGSCHCGAIRYEADVDLSQGGGKCNCSICRKTRNWALRVQPDNFRLLSGADATADYQFNSRSMHHLFCRTCGARPYAYGDIPQLGGKFFTIQLACLDDVSADELAGLPVRYSNGRDNDWMHEPSAAEKAVL